MVMTSASTPSSSLRARLSSTTSLDAKSARSAVLQVVRPIWQYVQSKVQVLGGIRSTPRDRPSRREGTGPKTPALPVRASWGMGGRQRSEVRGQRSEVRRQRAEGRARSRAASATAGGCGYESWLRLWATHSARGRGRARSTRA